MSDISGSTSQAENEDEGEGVKKCKWELDDGTCPQTPRDPAN